MLRLWLRKFFDRRNQGPEATTGINTILYICGRTEQVMAYQLLYVHFKLHIDVIGQMSSAALTFTLCKICIQQTLNEVLTDLYIINITIPLCHKCSKVSNVFFITTNIVNLYMIHAFASMGTILSDSQNLARVYWATWFMLPIKITLTNYTSSTQQQVVILRRINCVIH